MSDGGGWQRENLKQCSVTLPAHAPLASATQRTVPKTFHLPIEDSQRHGNSSAETEVCFVIMPFGQDFDVQYENIYKTAIDKAGLVAIRADDIFRPGVATHDIWELTSEAKVILADLTGKNPNVFYELGLAHATAKPVILVSDSMEDIPFDLRGLRIISHEKNQPDWSEKLQKAIVNAIADTKREAKATIFPPLADDIEKEKDKVLSLEKELADAKKDIRKQIQATEQAKVDSVLKYLLGWSGKTYDEIYEDLERVGFSSTDVSNAFAKHRIYHTNQGLEFFSHNID